MTSRTGPGIMVVVGDQQEPRKQPPEVIDGEVVEPEPGKEVARGGDGATRTDRPPLGLEGTDDSEYQEFLEFKRFKEWQAANGGQPPKTEARPWWKKALGLLRYKAIRRILYLLVALLLLNWAYNHYFGSSDRADEADPVQAHRDHLHTNPIRQTKPMNAVRTVYDALATEPGTVCEKFTPQGRAGFARGNNAPDCQAAVNAITAQITEPMLFKNPNFTGAALDHAQQDDVTIRGCDTQVTGGPNLGDFELHRQPTGGWVIVSLTPAGPC
ncbi:hypothetical protein [Saccharopolyspora griseoalba]|uniref:Uncharacterized protein n=1 Tax=Saccharopolyspora griseoalba TaxID=1431848 RepID=A0ABW2LKM6_9PSEU